MTPRIPKSPHSAPLSATPPPVSLELALMAKQGRAGIGGRQKGLGLSHGESGAAHKIVKKRDLSGKLTQKAPVSLVDKNGKPYKSARKAELAARKERRSQKAEAANQ